MVTRNAVKHYKATTTSDQPSAEGKKATQTLNVKGQSQQMGRTTTTPPLVAPSTPVVNKGKFTGMGK